MTTSSMGGSRDRQVGWLSVGILLFIVALALLGAKFEPRTITAVSFELAQTPEDFGYLLNPAGSIPPADNAKVLLEQTLLDFILIILYWSLLWSLAALCDRPFQLLSAGLKFVASLAALLDLLENTGMLLQLEGLGHPALAKFTHHAAIGKWSAFSLALVLAGSLLLSQRAKGARRYLLGTTSLLLITAGAAGALWLLTPQPQFPGQQVNFLAVMYLFLGLGLLLSATLFLFFREKRSEAESEAVQEEGAQLHGESPDRPREGVNPGGGGDDAVCFTAGPTGAYFGAGVIHAYLAARRKHPVITAGISLGAVSAAAMQKCYRELQSAPPAAPSDSARARESSDRFWRWSWFRRYVQSLTDRPLAVIWDALPDMSDFFADMPPVQDKSLPKRDEAEAREQRYILIKLGRRLANLPISVRTVAETFIYYVRTMERYGDWSMQRLLVRGGYLFVEFCGFICAPVYDNFFIEPQQSGREPSFLDGRPLFGWRVWAVAMTITGYLTLLVGGLSAGLALLAYRSDLAGQLGAKLFLTGGIALALMLSSIRALDIPLLKPEYPLQDKLRSLVTITVLWAVLWLATADAWLLSQRLWNGAAPPIAGMRRVAAEVIGAWPAAGGWTLVLAATTLLLLLVTVLAMLLAFLVPVGLLIWGINFYKRRTDPDFTGLRGSLLKDLKLNREIITDFYIMQRLKHLFDPKAERTGGFKETISDTPMPVLLVSASLQSLEISGTAKKGAQQIWPTAGAYLVKALRASIAKPGLMKPVQISGEELDKWLDRTSYCCSKLSRLDLVDGSVIRQNPLPALFAYLSRHKALAAKLSRPGGPSIHVVFNVPLEPRQETPEKPLVAPSNIVDVGLLSLKLAERRDTKMEVQQTNFVSKLENLIIESGCESGLRQWGESEGNLKEHPLETLPLSADCIGPEDDIDIGPALSPQPDKALKTMAAGCRQTLQRLYADQLAETVGDLPCRRLLAQVWLKHQEVAVEVPDPPGLPEICSACTGMLLGAAEPERDKLTLSEQDFPELTGEKPRVVFVASGGVFRGAFQVGVLAALLKAGIKIDLAVGASVGTLMGGALAAAASSNSEEVKERVIRELYLTFLKVDEKVALTAPLKSAIREIGVRGRSIQLSPSDIQRMIRRGSRFDPGFAVAGAPPALLDAISALFALPYEDTKRIAASFVSGHIALAVTELLHQMKKETLGRLGIEEYLMGVSLLRGTAERLLFPDLSVDRWKAQPYLSNGEGVALFGTATNLLTWKSILLGDPAACSGKYDFIEAALSSSAFPAVFQPRRETDVYPGHGDPKVLYSDGGMFDNLPFIPALDVLTGVQSSSLSKRGAALGEGEKVDQALRSLKQRHATPDLFIVGSLDAEPDSDPKLSEGPFNSILSVRSRAAQLNANLKISDFQLAGVRVHDQVGRLLHAAPEQLPQGSSRFLNAIIDAAVLPVYPVNRGHLNPTFAFCRTLKLQPKRIRRTVSNGCFQTLAAIAKAQAFRPKSPEGPAQQYDPASFRARTPEEVLSKSVWALFQAGKVPYVAKTEGKGCSSGDTRNCPYFTVSATLPRAAAPEAEKIAWLPCPFAGSGDPDLVEVFTTCCSDHLNWQALAAFNSAEVPERYYSTPAIS